MKTSVLVLGAGELGNEVLRALATHSKRNANAVTVLLRSGWRAATDPIKVARNALFEELRISVVEGDIATAPQGELAALFAPFHTVVGCSGMACPPGTQLKLAQAVLSANVRRYLPWQFGIDYDTIGRASSQGLFSEQLDVRDLLRRQAATEWVIISTGMFMSFLFEPGFGVVSDDLRTVRALGAWENSVTVTTVEDIGKVVAEVVWAAPKVNGVIYTAGDTVCYRQVADVVEKVYGAKIERESWGIPKLAKDLNEDPTNGIKKYRVVFAEGKGVFWDQDDTFNAQRGMRLESVEEWVRRKYLANSRP
ncbi:hypothetical protein MMC30_006508 [Trapelia coarctata]|nr:hypothetical protein [Trapelia coarctata]